MCRIHGRNIKLVLEYNSVWAHIDPITDDVEKFNHLRPSRLYDSTYRFAVRFKRISSDIALRFFSIRTLAMRSGDFQATENEASGAHPFDAYLACWVLIQRCGRIRC